MASGFPTNQAPLFSSNQVGSDIVFSHREFIQDIKSSINFSATKFVLNPANPVLFPWLSQIARLYEEYSFEGVVFEYKSSSASAVGTTSSAMGSIIMATDYYCADENYTNKREMESAEFATSGQPFDSFIHPIECDPKRNPLPRLYCVPNITQVSDAPDDPRFAVHGVTTVAAVGQQVDGDIIGELWGSYHVRLSRPILESSSSGTPYTMRVNGFHNDTGPATSIHSTTMGNILQTPFTTSCAGTGASLIINLVCTASHVGQTYTATVRSILADDTAGITIGSTPCAAIGTATTPNLWTSPAGTYDSDSALAIANYNNSTPSSAYNESLNTATFTCNAVGDGVAMYIPNASGHITYFDVLVTQVALGTVAGPKRNRNINDLSQRLLKLEAELSKVQNVKSAAASSSSSSSSSFVQTANKPSSVLTSTLTDHSNAAAAACATNVPAAVTVTARARDVQPIGVQYVVVEPTPGGWSYAQTPNSGAAKSTAA